MSWSSLSRLLVGVTAATLITLASPSAHAQTARVTFQSQPGDFIGQGQTYDFTYTPANTAGGGLFFANIRTAFNVAGQPAYLEFSFDTPELSPNRFTTLTFATNQLGVPLSTGTFLNAERAAFASPGRPGLDVSFQNRGSNTLTGNFTVTDLAFVNSGNGLVIDRFAASFEQRSEASTGSLFGTLTFLSATAAPEPGSITLTLFGGISLLGVALRRRKP